MIFGDLQTPELVLKHDGHFIGILLNQKIGNVDAGKFGLEGEIEMMRTDKPLFRDAAQRLAHDGTQRVVRQSLIPDVVLAHPAKP